MPPDIDSTAKRRVRVLLLEDRVTDAELVLRELRRAGFAPDWLRVETEAEFDSHLNSQVDVILADYQLPSFDGLAALRLLQRHNLDIPFIIISGALGDEAAAQCIKLGVTDYLLKDRLERLGLAVSNALEEKRLRIEAEQVEAELRQAQKMESVGQLAGGIAHDFNNVLTVINGRASLLLEDESLSPEVRRAANEIYMAGERAANLTRQLLLFSRKRPIHRTCLDLNDTIQDVGTMLSRLIGEHIDLRLELADELPPIDGDSGMVEQVLINLAVNARDAMPRGGQLAISTRLVELTLAESRARAEAKPGSFVRLRVEDSGAGIPPEVMPRIFEPFFTTKPAGKGTGVGLATVFGIVKQHDGWIEVASKPGVGTAFEIFLPTAKPRKPQPVKPWNFEPLPHGGHETILIVEDETSVREYAAAVLQPAGYRVLQARSARDGMEVWKRHSARIELLLTDVVLPDDLSGSELAAVLLAEKPSLAVLYTSGYTKDTADRVFDPGVTAKFIPKPYYPRALAHAVREMLDARSRAQRTPSCK